MLIRTEEVKFVLRVPATGLDLARRCGALPNKRRNAYVQRYHQPLSIQRRDNRHPRSTHEANG